MTMGSECDHSSKKTWGFVGSIPRFATAIHMKSGRKAPVSNAQAGVSGKRLFMARPAAKCAAYTSLLPYDGKY